jgi:hypothetical protein
VEQNPWLSFEYCRRETKRIVTENSCRTMIEYAMVKGLQVEQERIQDLERVSLIRSIVPSAEWVSQVGKPRNNK